VGRSERRKRSAGGSHIARLPGILPVENGRKRNRLQSPPPPHKNTTPLKSLEEGFNEKRGRRGGGTFRNRGSLVNRDTAVERKIEKGRGLRTAAGKYTGHRTILV